MRHPEASTIGPLFEARHQVTRAPEPKSAVEAPAFDEAKVFGLAEEIETLKARVQRLEALAQRLEALAQRQQAQLEQLCVASLRSRDATQEAADEQRASASERWKSDTEERLETLEKAREDLKAWTEAWFFSTFLPEARLCAKTAAEGVQAAAGRALEESREQTCDFLLTQLETRLAELDDRVLLFSRPVRATLLRPDTCEGEDVGISLELHHPMQRCGDTVYMRRAVVGGAGELRVTLFPVEDADGPVVCFE